jgi:hypothetical protein
MPKKQESKWNIEEMTDPDIFDAIRYLEPDRAGANEQNDDTALVICATAVILLLGCLGFVWLYLR